MASWRNGPGRRSAPYTCTRSWACWRPAVRSKGGFRLYPGKAVKRIDWIQKLQDLGFSLTEIKAFLARLGGVDAAPKAMARVREIFSDKLRETKETIARLERLVGDLTETLAYMDSCRSCEPDAHADGVRHLRHPRARRPGTAAGRRDFTMTLKLPIYMDNHSTTPVDPRVLEAMLPYFTEEFGNAASRNHAFGWTAEEAVEKAREQVGALIGGDRQGDRLDVGRDRVEQPRASRASPSSTRSRATTSSPRETEHKAVLDTCKRLEREGFEVTYLPVEQGRPRRRPRRCARR